MNASKFKISRWNFSWLFCSTPFRDPRFKFPQIFGFFLHHHFAVSLFMSWFYTHFTLIAKAITVCYFNLQKTTPVDDKRLAKKLKKKPREKGHQLIRDIFPRKRPHRKRTSHKFSFCCPDTVFYPSEERGHKWHSSLEPKRFSSSIWSFACELFILLNCQKIFSALLTSLIIFLPRDHHVERNRVNNSALHVLP